MLYCSAIGCVADDWLRIKCSHNNMGYPGNTFANHFDKTYKFNQKNM